MSDKAAADARYFEMCCTFEDEDGESSDRTFWIKATKHQYERHYECDGLDHHIGMIGWDGHVPDDTIEAVSGPKERIPADADDPTWILDLTTCPCEYCDFVRDKNYESD